jgi:general secretion pathway protein A
MLLWLVPPCWLGKSYWLLYILSLVWTKLRYLELLNIFKNYLTEQALTHNKNLVLLIDEAQTLKPPLLEMLRQLMNFESNDQKFLQVVLFAQEDFRRRLQHPRYANLVNRVAMSSSIDPLFLSETSAMLKHRWLIAGGKDNFPFTDNALEQLFIYSKGIPRTQIILADNSLLAAYLLQQRTIDADLRFAFFSGYSCVRACPVFCKCSYSLVAIIFVCY